MDGHTAGPRKPPPPAARLPVREGLSFPGWVPPPRWQLGTCPQHRATQGTAALGSSIGSPDSQDAGGVRVLSRLASPPLPRGAEGGRGTQGSTPGLCLDGPLGSAALLSLARWSVLPPTARLAVGTAPAGGRVLSRAHFCPAQRWSRQWGPAGRPGTWTGGASSWGGSSLPPQSPEDAAPLASIPLPLLCHILAHAPELSPWDPTGTLSCCWRGGGGVWVVGSAGGDRQVGLQAGAPGPTPSLVALRGLWAGAATGLIWFLSPLPMPVPLCPEEKPRPK